MDIVHLPDLFDDGLQNMLKALGPGIEQFGRDGKYHVWKINVDGRLTRALLGRLKQVNVPLKLNLSDSHILSDQDLAMLAGHPQIYGMSLGYPSSSFLSVDGIRSLATLENLEDLNLSYPKAEMVPELAGMPRLRVLELGSTDASPESFDVLKKLPQLEVVSLSLQRDQVAAAIKALAELPKLTSLHLESNLTESDLAALAEFPKLQGLALRGCEDLDAKLAVLARFDNLRELAIESGQVAEAGLSSLKGMKRLEGLDLSWANVESGEILREFHQLKWLALPRDKEELLKTLRQQLPNLRAF